MDKIKSAIDRIGKKLFPDMEESRRRVLSVRIAVGLLTALICTAGMWIYRCRAEKELRKYQIIMDYYQQLDSLFKEIEEEQR